MMNPCKCPYEKHKTQHSHTILLPGPPDHQKKCYEQIKSMQLSLLNIWLLYLIKFIQLLLHGIAGKKAAQGQEELTSMWTNQLLIPEPDPFSKWYPGGLPSKQTARYITVTTD
jgi:hypothetical protein